MLDTRTASIPLPQPVIDRLVRAIEDHYPKDEREGVKFQTLCSANVFDYQEGHSWAPSERFPSKAVLDGHRRIKNTRKWIEHFCRIQDKAGEIVPITLNAAQRKFLAKVLRRWRNGEPSRVVILKPRQTGFSTVVELLIFYLVVTSTYKRGEVIAHKRAISSKVLGMFRRALKFIPFELNTNHRTRYEVVFDEPLNCAVDVDSAESDEPGHGDTLQYLHLTEVSRWKDARRKAKGVMQTVPQLPGTLIVWESTANGAEGYFYELYFEALDTENLANRMDAVFVAWYEHEEYTAPPLDEAFRAHIIKTMTDEEERLLGCTYFVRKKGWVKVTLEQIVWRRDAILNKCGGNLDDFQEQYPATDLEAFLASGRPVFSPEKLIERDQVTRDAEWRGDIFDPLFTPREVPDTPGSLADIKPEASPAGPRKSHVDAWPAQAEWPVALGHESEANDLMNAFGGAEGESDGPTDIDSDPEWT